MKRIPLSCLLLAACCLALLGAAGNAVTKDVDIVVTHGTDQVLSTYTIKETSGKNQPAGSVYIGGQAFRRGDLPPGTYPVFRDPNTHAPLVQQLDEIATRRENGDDGSIRHLVFSVQLPAIAANGSYTMEIVKQAGTYAATGKQNLPALASAHDLKLHLTDVRNQDGSVRGSGSLTFDINQAASNTGRDAPRRCGAGPVRDCWIVVGPPVDDASHQADPLLYVTCYLDLTTSPADQASLGPVRHVCRVDNSWMNVKAGSKGNAGNPGPAGFANDPQVVSYRPQLLDGTANLLDWSWYDAAVDSSSSPVTVTSGDTGPSNCDGHTDSSGKFISHTLASTGNWTIPTSTGKNSWYKGMAVKYSTTGTPPAGLTNNNIYFVQTIGLESSASDLNNTKIVHLAAVPFPCYATNQMINPNTQGNGAQNFSFRVWHTHWMGWYALDQSGNENWTAGGSNALYPAFTAAEQLYWKETGVVPPLKMTVAPQDPIDAGQDEQHLYAPMSQNNMIGGPGTGERGTLGLTNEYFSQAFLLETPAAWQHARVAALASTAYAWSTVLDEATGRIPILNNGPPAANHGGSGVPYMDGGVTVPLRAAQMDIFDGTTMDGLAQPLLNVPVNTNNGGYVGGIWGPSRSYGNDHVPSYANGIYQVFGSRHFLDAMYFAGNRSVYVVSIGDYPAHQVDTKGGVRYYGLNNRCCEIRGSHWSRRDKILPAALGGDNNIERTYFNDMLVENYWYEQAYGAFIDGPGNTNYRSDYVTPLFQLGESSFIQGYGGMVSYQGYAMLRNPLDAYFIQKWIRMLLVNCSDTDPNGLSSYWCASYDYTSNMTDTSQWNDPDLASLNTGNKGQYFVSNATEVGQHPSGFGCTPGSGTLVVTQPAAYYRFAEGDQVKLQTTAPPWRAPFGGPSDTLHTDTWYTVTNVTSNPDGGVQSIQIIDPATGKPFTSFIEKGAPCNNGFFYLKARLHNPKPPSGGWDTGYIAYLQPVAYGLHSLGFTSVDPAIAAMTKRGFYDPGSTATKFNWDQNVVVP